MLAHLRPALVMLAAFTLLTGIVYPLAVTGVAQVIMRHHASGSPVMRDGKVAGSVLIGQAFTSDRYFHGRPSAAGDKGYDAVASSGSNLGPTSRRLVERVQEDVKTLRQSSGATAIPTDAVTASASGLDPHISVASALYQVSRVACARGLSEAEVTSLVEKNTEGRQFGLFGEPRVNVLLLNLALDEIQ